MSTPAGDPRTTTTPGRVPGLDSLRALAVVTVLGYHLAVPGLPGGYLGVTVFFVVSGYLITRLLLTEVASTGSIDLGGFWRRRVRRLLPAAYLLVIAVLAYATVADRGLLVHARGDGVASLFYSSNWWMIFHQVSYFDSFGLPSPLAHLWTLAVEEQFYLVWPLLLLGLLTLTRRLARGRGVVIAVVAVLAAASALGMALGFDPTSDPSRIYLGTDTRAFELLIGALLALMVHRGGVDLFERLTFGVTWGLLGTGVLMLGVLMPTMADDDPFMFHGGLVYAAIASAALIAALSSPWLAFPADADAGLIGAIGRRSYSIYLWHYPLVVLFSTAATIDDFSWRRFLLVVPLTLVAAELSYRFVEQPIRRLGVRTAFWTVAFRVRALARVPRLGVVAVGAAVAILAVGGLTGIVPARHTEHGPSVVLVGSEPMPAPSTPTVAPGRAPHSGVVVGPRAPGKQPDPEPEPRGLWGRDTVAVGDSLMIDISPRLQQVAPKISIDAEVGRQPYDGLRIATRYGQFNRPGGTYLLGIGTNGGIDVKGLFAFCRAHPTARILLITPHVDRTWERTSVSAIWAAARRFRHVGVVDFHKIADGHPEYFAPDAVHLTQPGVNAMVRAIRETALRTPESLTS